MLGDGCGCRVARLNDRSDLRPRRLAARRLSHQLDVLGDRLVVAIIADWPAHLSVWMKRFGEHPSPDALREHPDPAEVVAAALAAPDLAAAREAGDAGVGGAGHDGATANLLRLRIGVGDRRLECLAKLARRRLRRPCGRQSGHVRRQRDHRQGRRLKWWPGVRAKMRVPVARMCELDAEGPKSG